jgi:hypothetical protein
VEVSRGETARVGTERPCCCLKVALLYVTMFGITPKIVEPGDDARAAEHVVALITKYAVRFDPVDRITFYSGLLLRPFRCRLERGWSIRFVLP